MLLFRDSFDHYTTYAQCVTKWTNTSGTNSASFGAFGRNGTNGFRSGVGAGYITSLGKTLPANYVTLIAGIAFKPVGGQNAILIQFRDGGTEQLALRYSGASNQLQITRNGTVIATGTTVLSIGVYYYVELKAVFDNTAGSYEVHINTIQEAALTASSVDTTATANNYANQVWIGGGATTNASSGDHDDFYVCDNSGTQNNSFLGDIKVLALFPNGAGNYSQWTPSSAVANYTTVDETTPNDDTDYNASSTAGQLDSYAFQDILASGIVKAVTVIARLRTDDANIRTVQPLTRISATDYTGNSWTVGGTTYTYFEYTWELSPASASAWTTSEITNAEFGVKLVS